MLTEGVDSSYEQERKMAEVNYIVTCSRDCIAAFFFAGGIYNVPVCSDTLQCVLLLYQLRDINRYKIKGCPQFFKFTPGSV
jgi:hypothetical protein